MAVSSSSTVSPLTKQNIAGHVFSGYGAHHTEYPCAYLTFACAMGAISGEKGNIHRICFYHCVYILVPITQVCEGMRLIHFVRVLSRHLRNSNSNETRKNASRPSCWRPPRVAMERPMPRPRLECRVLPRVEMICAIHPE